MILWNCKKTRHVSLSLTVEGIFIQNFIFIDSYYAALYSYDFEWTGCPSLELVAGVLV